MPFGISSAPQVWQQKMHEIVEGLSGVEVIGDDFLICGFGATKEQAIYIYIYYYILLLIGKWKDIVL